jgi:hypothetical protein
MPSAEGDNMREEARERRMKPVKLDLVELRLGEAEQYLDRIRGDWIVDYNFDFLCQAVRALSGAVAQEHRERLGAERRAALARDVDLA